MKKLICSFISGSNLKLLALVLFILAGFLILSEGCQKDDDKPKKKAYSNMRDDSTTAIQVSIPRIELGPGRSTLINVFLSVTDQDGNPFTEFTKYNFKITEVCEGETDTTLVASITFNKIDVEGYNIAAAMTMDYSGSMETWDIENMEIAARQFVRMKEDIDYCEIIKFSDYYDVVQSFTSDTALLIQAIDSYYYSGYTAFCDAVYTGINDAAYFIQSQTTYVPAVLGFTDGWDNNSYTADYYTCVQTSIDKQVPVYTIGYGDADSVNLKYLAENTGGRYFYTPNSSDLVNLYDLISGQLKNLYKVTWEYDNPGCMKVWVYVTASYTCANGTFIAQANKYFYPLKK
jgi:hypothetical protein